MNDEKFEKIYNIIDEIINDTDDMIDKWIHDWEIAVDHEAREEVEEIYGMPWWKVLSEDDDYNPEDDYEEDEKIVELKDWNTENFRYFKIVPSEKSKVELGLPDDFYYVVIVDLKKQKITCDCYGNLTHGYCKHIQMVAEKLKNQCLIGLKDKN
jgi:hypothetical protein